MKEFAEALKDGFIHVTQVTDPAQLTRFREEGVAVDEEGYYSFAFGDTKEYELCVEPIGEDGQYRISLYKNRVLLTQPLPVCRNKENRQ